MYIDIVKPESIDTVTKIPIDCIQPFKGTMPVHQWTWKKLDEKLIFVTMNCYFCGRGEKCQHYSIGNPWRISEPTVNQSKKGTNKQAAVNKKPSKTKTGKRANLKKNNAETPGTRRSQRRK